ncbi:hypothetical protein [Paraburkholderia kururiensis]|uniref:hypothetical protein n=1 Tax=Paraburkholderia kururiensis TaxID=984307 RepID=UPI001F2D9521|nr:hypothetical protein [Paraburkholderia kururiensis]
MKIVVGDEFRSAERQNVRMCASGREVRAQVFALRMASGSVEARSLETSSPLYST